jgi:hypothetical protein
MSIEKRYQVFVSSTFKDLQKERQQAIQALLELNCFPCSMELFPAANEEVWEGIKLLINDCDYYLVIVAGKYGSVDEEGISFTQKEYEYAVQRGIPVLAFLHSDPEAIPMGKSETTQKRQKKLEEFRQLCRNRLCCEWNSADELKAKVTVSLVQSMKRHPAIGWVRGDLLPNESAAQTINRLRLENDELKAKLENFRQQGPPEAENFAQGEDAFNIRFYYKMMPSPGSQQQDGNNVSNFTWNGIFLALAPKLLTSASEHEMREQLGSSINQKFGQLYWQIRIDEECFEQIKIQLLALGLIMKGVSSATSPAWTLTPFGEQTMLRMKAIPKSI